MLYCLQKFCVILRQSVSKENTKVFSNNFGFQVRNQIKSRLGFGWTNNIGRYLGVNINHGWVSHVSIKGIINKARARLSVWKQRTLPFTSRVTLTMEFHQALPSNSMQPSFLLRAICNDLDKICRNFIWGDCGGSRGLHIGSQDNICKPEEMRGWEF